MKKKTLYIVIELKVREFIAKLLFSYFASLRGYRIYLGSREQIFNIIEEKKTKAGLFFYKAGLQLDKTIQISKKVNTHITLDEEMTAGLNTERYYTGAKAFFKGAKKYIDGYFYINNKIAKIVKKQIKVKNVYSAGWPRVDLYKKEFSNIYKEDVTKIKKNFGDYYLFMSDLGFISKDYAGYALEYLPFGGTKKDGKNWHKYSLNKAQNAFEEFSYIINFFKNICKKNKNIKILVRAHPSENFKAWRNAFKDTKNLILLTPNDDPQPWIMASKGVLHRGCSTSFQAFALNKPIAYLKLNPNFNNKFIKRRPYEISYKIFNESDFFKWIKIKKKNNFSLIKKELNFDNKKHSCNKILDIVDDMKIDKENIHYLIDKKTSIKDIFNFYFLKLKNYVYIFLVISKILKRNKDRIYFTPKIPNGIKKKEAIKFMKKIKRKKTENINISQISKDLLKIEKFQ